MERKPVSRFSCAHTYMFLFSLRLTEVYWVVYLREKGLSYAAVGLLETVFHVASFSSEIPTGIIADRFGRKVSLSVGRALSAVSAILVLYAKSWPLLAASFAVNAISYTCHSGAFEALIYDSLPYEKRPEFTRLIGNLNSTYLAGTAVAGGIAALVARYSLDWLYRTVVVVDIVAAVIALALPESNGSRNAAGGQDDDDGHVNRECRSDLRTLRASLSRPGIRNLLLLWGIAGALATSVVFYGQSLLKEALLPVSVVGLAGTAGNLLAILPTSSAHRLQDKYGQRLPLVAGSYALPALAVMIAAVPGSSGWLPRVALVALYVAIPVVQETLYPLFSNAVNVRTGSLNRAAVLSAGGMVFSISMMAVFPLIGHLGDRLGLRWGVLAGACLTSALLAPVAAAIVSRSGEGEETPG